MGDTVIAAYLCLAFTAFDAKGETKAVCSKVDINIADGSTNGFLDAATIKQNLQKAGCYPQIGKPVGSVNTRLIEETLIQRTFVKTAECYKTEDGHVYISVTQRMPIIRIMADNGDNYYVDDNDRIMKCSNYTSDLIIATGAINRTYATRYLSPLGKAIMSNDLWKNLIEQINVKPDKSIELVPRIGGHIVCIGMLPEVADNKKREKAILDFITKKMTRLEKFYKYGLSVVGWNKYSYINIEFDNQIICKKREGYVANATEKEPEMPTTNATPTENATNGNTTDGENSNKVEANNENKKPQKEGKEQNKEKQAPKNNEKKRDKEANEKKTAASRGKDSDTKNKPDKKKISEKKISDEKKSNSDGKKSNSEKKRKSEKKSDSGKKKTSDTKKSTNKKN